MVRSDSRFVAICVSHMITINGKLNDKQPMLIGGAIMCMYCCKQGSNLPLPTQVAHHAPKVDPTLQHNPSKCTNRKR